MSRLSSGAVNPGGRRGFWGGFITGVSLGLVWSPCAGPILATIATLAATQQVSLGLVLVTLSYVVGVGIPLFLFATFSNVLFTRSKLLSPYTGRIQQVFGIIMLLTAVAIYTNYDKVIQAKLLDIFPSYSKFLYKLEGTESVKKQLDILKEQKKDMESAVALPAQGNAPEFVGIEKWLNSEPLTMQSLRGKVVLVDFWTYTCINCIRTLPHVTSWYEKYKDKGFVVVGVHTPEFEFEKKKENVENAIKQYGIRYPVAQDNNYATWKAYSNQYWPAEYLIDAKGVIRRTHFGEGEYDKTEEAIQALLTEAGGTVTEQVSPGVDETPRMRLTPETYVGSRRSEGRAQLSGKWSVQDEYAESGKDSSLLINFYANKVFLVITPKNANDVVKVYLDDKLVDVAVAGKDVRNGKVVIDTARLYELINLKGAVGNHTLRLEFLTPGVKIYAFTFG